MRRRVYKLALLLLFAVLIAALGTPAAVVEAPAARQPVVEQEVRRGIHFGSGWPGADPFAAWSSRDFVPWATATPDMRGE